MEIRFSIGFSTRVRGSCAIHLGHVYPLEFARICDPPRFTRAKAIIRRFCWFEVSTSPYELSAIYPHRKIFIQAGWLFAAKWNRLGKRW
jgi:hypothetical protein